MPSRTASHSLRKSGVTGVNNLPIRTLEQLGVTIIVSEVVTAVSATPVGVSPMAFASSAISVVKSKK
jgi:hypothetical protein